MLRLKIRINNMECEKVILSSLSYIVALFVSKNNVLQCRSVIQTVGLGREVDALGVEKG